MPLNNDNSKRILGSNIQRPGSVTGPQRKTAKSDLSKVTSDSENTSFDSGEEEIALSGKYDFNQDVARREVNYSFNDSLDLNKILGIQGDVASARDEMPKIYEKISQINGKNSWAVPGSDSLDDYDDNSFIV